MSGRGERGHGTYGAGGSDTTALRKPILDEKPDLTQPTRRQSTCARIFLFGDSRQMEGNALRKVEEGSGVVVTYEGE